MPGMGKVAQGDQPEQAGPQANHDDGGEWVFHGSAQGRVEGVLAQGAPVDV